MIQITPGFYLFAASLLLVLPLPWLMSAMVAAVVHELSHLLCVQLAGGAIREIRIGSGGIVMAAELEGNAREMLCVLAGPAGSALLLLFLRIWPRLAVCGLIQGLFNLLPVYPLDGGRALRCLLEKKGIGDIEKAMLWVESVAFIVIFLCCTVVAICYSMGKTPLMVIFLLLLKGIMRKRPCKAGRIGVQ